ncbi:MAG: FAD-dependent oxidoreductase [Rhodobacterales bacterium]
MNRLVLVGGGLVHLEVLRRMASTPFPDTEVVLVSDRAQAVYAGMLPGVVSGFYETDEMTVDLAGLAKAAGITFQRVSMTGLDAGSFQVLLQDGARLDYTHMSLNTGATARSVSETAKGKVLSIKPAPVFMADLCAWEESALRDGQVGVIGGGVAGIELAFALAHRWKGCRPAPVLVERSGTALERVPAAARARVRRHLDRAGITVHTSDTAPELDLSINAAGAAAPAWLSQTGLPLDKQGFVVICPTLQVEGHDRIFASGDMAGMRDHPRAKAGVFAVRQGPALYRNLSRVLAGQSPLPHLPQTDWLSLIATGGRHAIATRNSLAIEGAFAWWMKDINDRSYLKKYRGITGGTSE